MIIAGAVSSIEELEVGCARLTPEVVVSDLWFDAGLASRAVRALGGLPTVWVRAQPDLATGPFLSVHELDGDDLSTAVRLSMLGRRRAGLPTAARESARSLVRSFPDAVALFDGRGELVELSNCARLLLGGDHWLEDRLAPWRMSDGSGDRWSLEDHPLGRVIFGGASEAFAQTTVDGRELRLVVSEARLGAVFEGRAAWLRWERGEPGSATRQRMALVGHVTAGIAHDFNNVMTAILAFADFARQDAREPSVVADLDELLRTGQRAARLTRKLLMLGRADDAAVAVDANAQLQELAPLLRRSLRPGISLEIRHSEELAFVLIDPTAFDQIVLNLVVNARDAIRGKGAITIVCATSPDAVRVTVRDDGVGMNEETRRRVFEPGYSTKSRDVGSGLGLATSRSLARAAGGELSCSSELGAGSSFELSLPPSPISPSIVPEHVSDVPPPSIAGELALVVDADGEVRSVVSRILHAAGYRVVTAVDGDVAERELRRHRSEARLIVADTQSTDVARLFTVAARVVPRAARVVLGSGGPTEPSVRVRKPFSRLALLEAVHDARVRRSEVRPVRVLLVEPDMDACKLMQAYLARDGHDAASATSLQTARSLLDAVRFDVVVTERTLPDGSAFELARLSRASGRPVLVCMSTTTDPTSEDLARREGFDDFLAKPVDPRVLATVLDEHTRTTRWVLVVSDDPAVRGAVSRAISDIPDVRALHCETDEAALVALEDGFELAILDERVVPLRHGIWRIARLAGTPTIGVARSAVLRVPNHANHANLLRAPLDTNALVSAVRRRLGRPSEAEPATPRRRGSTRATRRSAITLQVPDDRIAEVRARLAELGRTVTALMSRLDDADLVEARRAIATLSGLEGELSDVASIASEIDAIMESDPHKARRRARDLAGLVSRLRVTEAR
jgi:signal transduction histidine kinase/DNA-binding response OmpR family regulator